MWNLLAGDYIWHSFLYANDGSVGEMLLKDDNGNYIPAVEDTASDAYFTALGMAVMFAIF